MGGNTQRPIFVATVRGMFFMSVTLRCMLLRCSVPKKWEWNVWDAWLAKGQGVVEIGIRGAGEVLGDVPLCARLTAGVLLAIRHLECGLMSSSD